MKKFKYILEIYVRRFCVKWNDNLIFYSVKLTTAAAVYVAISSFYEIISTNIDISFHPLLRDFLLPNFLQLPNSNLAYGFEPNALFIITTCIDYI